MGSEVNGVVVTVEHVGYRRHGARSGVDPDAPQSPLRVHDSDHRGQPPTCRRRVRKIVVIPDEVEFETALERATELHGSAPGSPEAEEHDALLRGLADYDGAISMEDLFLLGR